MHRIIQLYFLLAACLGLSLEGFSQTGLGILSSNYAGVSTVKFNPAIADNNLNYDINIGSLYMASSSRLLPGSGANFFTGMFHSWGIVSDNLYNYSPGKYYSSAELQGPGSFMVNFGSQRKNGLAFTYNYNVVQNSDSNAVRSLSWLDIDATYSRVLFNNSTNLFKAGLTLKGIVGAGTINEPRTGTSGKGFASDIGLVYEWRPKIKKYYYEMDGDTARLPFDKDLYTLRLAFSATDLGFMSDTLTANGKTRMPMRFNFSVDYNIVKGFGLNFIARIAAPQSSVLYVSHVTDFVFTPRFDTKWIGVYLPLGYDLNRNPSVGLAARLGPVFVGLDNFLMFQNKAPFRGGFYVALKIPFPYRLPKDRDKDKVSDKLDLCPDLPGPWATRGCPDSDGDGIPDMDDSCPHARGLAKNHGCPDRDNDGVIDKDDRCPDDSGSVALRGCPDRDGDGVADIDDSCPNVPGLIKLHGCPDADGDGVPDYQDSCPTKPGLAIHHGCPDTDGDGIYDDVDLCPNEVGPAANKGCPWPDSDGDGVPDNEDSCVFQPGPKSNHGCPTVKKVLIRDLEVIRDTLLFDIGSSQVSQFNKTKIDYLIKELKIDPTHGLHIIGYTDSTETDSEGYALLSRDRALAVRAVLLDNGIAPERLSVEGAGTENAVGNNKTLSGRRKNRRVEIYVQIATN